ncbi:MAG: hypothetical protein SOV95_08480 [Anaerovibrio sp.]|uniref:hypothetical protein n=1 Tax=Anaerovibrio sp. TaxID=1872532 RepID=UPI002626D7C6|nr:hypothetical protein [Anaerovibrio sp.]MDD7678666.1 hypothetical protein [Anaerovibrio sp.]MDY2604292.1 hypothetical protein [Anaerovibrio sp.]
MNKDFEHTQPLPRVSPDMESQKTQLLNVGKVRELEPVEIPRRQQQTDNGGHGGAGNMPPGDNTGINGMNSMNSINGRNGMNMNVPGNPPQKDRPGGRGKMIALLAVGFVVAAFCGAALSGYLSEQQAKKAALDSQHAAATRQLQEADSQQESLSRKKERLEAEYQRLLEEQKAAQSAADKLHGQKEQQEKSQQGKSAAGKVLDKITGDAGKQKKEAESTAAQEAEAKEKLESVSQSVQAAGAALEELDAQLDNLEAMRQQAKSVKADVDRAYSENKDTIDTVLHYVSVGLNALFK